MRRREFIGLMGSAAATWPFTALAQQPATPVIGFLNSASPESFAHLVRAFLQGLSETGYVEGRNVTIEYRWAEGKFERLPALATDLVDRHVAVIVATGGPAPALAAKAATRTIPIVFTGGADPVQIGLVTSLSRPGGNVTGVTNFGSTLEPKRFELLRELLARIAVVGILVNPKGSNVETQLRNAQMAAGGVGLQVHIVNASSELELEPAFAALVQAGAGGLVVGSDAVFTSLRNQLVALAARHMIPTIYAFRELTVAGGLISYGASITDGYRQVGIYAGRILKGAKPAELPVMQPTKFELVINLKTAKVLGLTVPPTLLVRADEVIE